MAAAGYVDIVHKETGMTSEVMESTLPAWETAGWTRTDNGSGETEQAPTPLETAPQPGFFDQTTGVAPGTAPSEE